MSVTTAARNAHNRKSMSAVQAPETVTEATAVIAATDVTDNDDDFRIAFRMRGEMILSGAAERVEMQRTIDRLSTENAHLRAALVESTSPESSR